MAQTAVTNFYATRKRYKEPVKSLKSSEHKKLSETFIIDKQDQTTVVDFSVDKVLSKPRGKKGTKVTDYLQSQPATCRKEKSEDPKPQTLSETTPTTSCFCLPPKGKTSKNTRGKKVNKVTNYLKPQSEISATKESEKLIQIKPSENLSDPELSTSKPAVTKSVKKTRGKKVNKVTDYLKPQIETNKSESEVLHAKKVEVSHPSDKNLSKNEIKKIPVSIPQTPKKNISKDEAPRTPKRNLSDPDVLTPSKKKVLQETAYASPSKLKDCASTPKKIEPAARKTLCLNTPSRIVSPRKVTSPIKNQVSPQKAATYENMSNKDLASLVHESRNKILFSGKLDDLKKSLSKFSKASAKFKEFQTNSCKITSVIASAKTSENEPKKVFQGEPAYKKYSYLAEPDSHALVLPYKYKVLAEAFRSMDSIVTRLYNRKQKITFDLVQEGVRDITKKTFLKSHLGKIMTVFPDAYTLRYEKNNSYSKQTPSYQLIISPNLSYSGGNSTSSESSTCNEKKNSESSHVMITPQISTERNKIFQHNLTSIVKRHHTDFLKRINFPSVVDKAIVRWHPDFKVDGIPDIPVAALPEEPDTKISTAKDVLDKIKGSVRGRVEKALQSVAEAHNNESKEKMSPSVESKNNSINKKQNSALQGICADLLEKIRARESQKLMEKMTRTVQDEKRITMLERLPKIVNILWHYFIAERKAAVSVDAAIDKIIHSFQSLATPEEVKDHLQLITETMPGWLSFIRIPKGEFITIDKKKDINEMISNIR